MEWRGKKEGKDVRENKADAKPPPGQTCREQDDCQSPRSASVCPIAVSLRHWCILLTAKQNKTHFLKML